MKFPCIACIVANYDRQTPTVSAFQPISSGGEAGVWLQMATGNDAEVEPRP